MDREKAISILEKHKYPDTCGQESLEKSNKAIDMAIEALKRLKNTAWLGTERELDDIKQAIQARDIASEALKIASEALKKVDSMIPLDGADIMLVTPEEYKAQEWIPVSERLPNETGTMKGYLVSIGEVVTIMAFVGGHFVEPVNGRLVQPDYPVQAWMGLPKPYREDGEEQNNVKD